MAIAKITSDDDVVNGLITVGAGAITASPQYRDDTSRTQHWGSGDALLTLETINGRYLIGGSGLQGATNWE